MTKKILIVGPAWIGDMVMAQTLFKLLKQNDDVSLHVIAPKWTLPLLERMPEVEGIIESPFGHGEFKLLQRIKLGRQFRQEQYDHAIILQNSWKSALIPAAASIPVRTGWRGESRYGLLNDMRILDKEKYPLMIERFMALGVALEQKLNFSYDAFWPSFKIDPQNVDETCAALNLQTNKPILALCPAAEFGPAKRWPAAYFAEIAKAKLQESWQVWIYGSNKDTPIAEEINKLCDGKCQDLTGKTNLGQAIDLLSLSRTVVSNDSGLMHLSAALQRPLVVLYGSSSPKFTPPLCKNVKIMSLDLECSPCFKRECPLGHLNCLKQLTPEMILKAMSELDDV